jgi:hypothetical protein
MGGLHILADYNPVHKVVAFGGGNGSRDLYKLDAQGNVTTLNPAPIVYNTHGSLMTTDPVTGDILFISNDSVYAYDIPSQTSRAAARSFIGTYSDVGSTAVIPVSTYGVIVFISDGTFPVLVYKHAEIANSIEEKVKRNKSTITISPNPFHPFTTIIMDCKVQSSSFDSAQDDKFKVQIYNLQGKMVDQLSLKPGQNRIAWQPTGLAAGIYTVKASDRGRTILRKVLYIK